MFAEVLKEARKVVAEGAVDVTVRFEGEFVFEVPQEDGTTGYDGFYTAEIRFDENGDVVPNYTCVRSFTTKDGETFDPNISFSEIGDFEHYPFKIESCESI